MKRTNDEIRDELQERVNRLFNLQITKWQCYPKVVYKTDAGETVGMFKTELDKDFYTQFFASEDREALPIHGEKVYFRLKKGFTIQGRQKVLDEDGNVRMFGNSPKYIFFPEEFELVIAPEQVQEAPKEEKKLSEVEFFVKLEETGKRLINHFFAQQASLKSK